MSSPTQKQIDGSILYASIMEEIKLRMSAIDHGTSGQMRALPPLIVKEFCFLLIRLICELLAIGCLVAHGDITGGTKLQKEWNAERITIGLGDLNPDFFPFPMTQSFDTKGGHNLTFEDGNLSKEEFLKMYVECGEVLHRGSLKNMLKQRFPTQIHFPDITAKLQRLNDLLNVHVVAIS